MLEAFESPGSAGICLLVLCGLPGSGKTKLAKFLAKQSASAVQNCTENTANYPYFVHIEYDELLPPEVEKDILLATKDEDQQESTWKIYRNDILACTEALIKCTIETRNKLCTDISLAQCFDEVTRPDSVRQDVWERFCAMVRRQTGVVTRKDLICFLIDDNMYYRSMRYKYFQLARQYTIGFCQCYIAIPVAAAIARNRERQVMVDDDVIRAMETKLEIPDGENNSWEKLTSVVKGEENIGDCLEEVVNLVRKAAENPVTMPEEVDREARDRSREICSANFHHQADQVMRRLISREMASAKEKELDVRELKTLANNLQERRKRLLHDLKTGVELVPRDLNTFMDDSKDTESRLFEFIQELFRRPSVT